MIFYNSLSDFGPMLLEEFNIIQPILVDGSEILCQLKCLKKSHYSHGFIHPRWLAGFWNHQQYHCFLLFFLLKIKGNSTSQTFHHLPGRSHGNFFEAKLGDLDKISRFGRKKIRLSWLPNPKKNNRVDASIFLFCWFKAPFKTGEGSSVT